MNASAASRSANRPYGQACVHCFKSKCKCIPRSNGLGCERCHRLNKHCKPSDSLRKRHLQQEQNSHTRIAQLEGKVSQLASLLESVTGSSNLSSALDNGLELGDTGNAGQGRQDEANEELAGTFSAPPWIGGYVAAQFGNGETTAPPHTEPEDLQSLHEKTGNPLNGSEISLEEGDALLDAFRNRMLPSCPFIHIPNNITSERLRRSRPFLFQAIMAVVTPLTSDKLARGKELKIVLAQKALVENEYSIDLLLGLLTFIAWSADQLLNRWGTLSRLMMIALSLAYDMRLNKPLPHNMHMVGQYLEDFDVRGGAKELETGRLEKHRAVLGCFILSSIISSYFAQNDPMRWTPHLEETIHIINTDKECQADQILIAQVRLQLLAQEAIAVGEQRNFSKNVSSPSPPELMYLKNIRLQLQETKDSFAWEVQQNAFIIGHIACIDLAINEAAYSANSTVSFTSTAVDESPNDRSGLERYQWLWNTVNAVKSWFDAFVALQPSDIIGSSFLSAAHMARCLVVLYRLSTLQDPAWDCQAVRDAVDLRQVLDNVVNKLELAGKEAGEKSSDDLFTQFAGRMRTFKAYVSNKFAPEETEMYSDMMDSVDLGNDVWLEAFLNSLG